VRLCGLDKGTYKVKFSGALNARQDFKVTVSDKDVKRTINFGFITARRGYKIEMGRRGKLVRKIAVLPGKSTQVTTLKDGSSLREPISVTVKANENREVPVR
jgi:hypothetical protein